MKVATRDASALTDADLDEFAAMGGAFGIGAVSKAKDSWVLATTAYDGKTLAGFMFLTLERLGGTPCVVMGLLSVKRTAKRDAAMKGLMTEAFHRALMAFPDEDVVVGARFVAPEGLEAFAPLTNIIPRPKYNAVGEERAWGRRLARRYAIEPQYDAGTFIAKSNAQTGFIDYEPAKKPKVPADIAAMFKGVNVAKGGVLIVHGWTMAESLAKLGKKR
ncbi:MAG: hypothetical protein KGQ43_08065 [Acidobacteria bacterium]|nr:hypothetical protein [Acidobacteriota bacterium]